MSSEPTAPGLSPAPDDAGIWRIVMETGESRLLVSFAQAAAIPFEPGYSANAKHWFNHLLVSPDGSRFIFLHRWRGDAEGKGFSTRLFTASAAGETSATGGVRHQMLRNVLRTTTHGAPPTVTRGAAQRLVVFEAMVSFAATSLPSRT
jgi:hypothetical protein